MASNIQPQYFLTLFPEFKKVELISLAAYLDLASLRVPSTVWGQATNYATALLCAHMLTCQGRSGQGSTGGAVTAEQVGDLSRSAQYVGEVGSGDSWLATTRYGVEFIELRNENIVAIMPSGRSRPRPFGYSI